MVQAASDGQVRAMIPSQADALNPWILLRNLRDDRKRPVCGMIVHDDPFPIRSSEPRTFERD